MKIKEVVKTFDDLSRSQNKAFKIHEERIENAYKEKSLLFEIERGKVGIFWIGSDEKVIPIAFDWVDTYKVVEMLPGWTSILSHDEPWPISTLIGMYPEYKGVSWEHIPRGRVFFAPAKKGEESIGEYSVYMAKEYLNNKNVKEQVLRSFNLPKQITKWNTDAHYNKHNGDISRSKIIGTVKEP